MKHFSIFLFWKNWSPQKQKQVGRFLLALGSTSLIAFLLYAASYHAEWFRFPLGHFLGIKIALKALKWLIVVIAFWFGKGWFKKKEQAQE